jgi:hypothetical protein
MIFCSRIDGNSSGFQLSQGILKEELLKTLEGGSSFDLQVLKPKKESRQRSNLGLVKIL